MGHSLGRNNTTLTNDLVRGILLLIGYNIVFLMMGLRVKKACEPANLVCGTNIITFGKRFDVRFLIWNFD